jgi:SAM-dependent methyltransferase
MASTERFGYEWDKYSYIDQKYEDQLENWLGPVNKDYFLNKTILDAGCGMGRNSYWSLKWGAKKLIAFDFDHRSVNRAKETLKEFGDKAEVIYKSIYEINWKQSFDIVFSIGVIHHLKDYEKALNNLYQSLKPGGKMIVWVYGREGNEWIVRLVDPIRKNITSKLPLPIVHFLSYFCSIPLYLFVKIFRGPSGYLKQISSFKFKHIHSIVFDQLIPEVANYWPKQEINEIFSKINGIKDFSINRPNNNLGWTIVCNK